MDAAGVGPWRVRCDPTRGQSAKPVPPERHQISGQLIFRGGGQAEGLAGDRRSAIDSARQPLPAVIGAISECESHPDAHALERNRSRSNASRSLCRSRLRLAQPYRITHRRHYFNCVLCQSLPQRPRKPAAYGRSHHQLAVSTRGWRTGGTVSDREAMARQRRTHSPMRSSTLLQPRSAQMMATAKN